MLARPVRNHQGVLLLEAGARISRKNIRIFKSWGVHDVVIKGAVSKAPDSAGRSEAGTEASIEEQLNEKFSDVLDDPVMVEIYKAARNQLIKSSA